MGSKRFSVLNTKHKNDTHFISPISNNTRLIPFSIFSRGKDISPLPPFIILLTADGHWLNIIRRSDHFYFLLSPFLLHIRSSFLLKEIYMKNRIINGEVMQSGDDWWPCLDTDFSCIKYICLITRNLIDMF